MANNEAPEAPLMNEDVDLSPNNKKRASQMLYANESIYAQIAYSNKFQNTTMVIIVLNAIWIGVDVQWNHHVYKEQRGDDHLPLEPASKIIENLFCAYFSIELVIRFLSFNRKLDCLKNNWFVFDGLLVLFMVIETWILEIIAAIAGLESGGLLSKFSALRLLRLLRLTRMTRIIREVPELITLLKGMIRATKAVSFILLFLLLCMYVFAIVFTAQLGDHKAAENFYAYKYWETSCTDEEMDDNCDRDPTANELFGSMGDSMMSLFTHGMLADNLALCMQAIKDRGEKVVCEVDIVDGILPQDCSQEPGGSWLLFWFFILFMIISAFCLLNMLIGVLCEVIENSAAEESETNQINELKVNMKVAFKTIDSSQDGLITKQEWSKMKDQATVRNSMANLGVEDQHIDIRLEQMQESLFGSSPDEEDEEDAARAGLTFDDFIEKVMEIRPDTDASALDIEILRVRVEREEKAFNQRLDLVEQALDSLNESDETAANDNPAAKENIDPYSSSPAVWLKEVPTEVLFAVLNSRAPPDPSPPKLLTAAGR